MFRKPDVFLFSDERKETPTLLGPLKELNDGGLSKYTITTWKD
jgi:hypothetical protein